MADPCKTLKSLALASVRENVCNNSKKRKKSCFLKFEKNVKKRRPTAYVQFHRPLNHSAFNTQLPKPKLSTVPVSHQHHTPCSEMRTQETNMQLTCRSVIVKRLQLSITMITFGNFEAKISIDMQQT